MYVELRSRLSANFAVDLTFRIIASENKLQVVQPLNFERANARAVKEIWAEPTA